MRKRSVLLFAAAVLFLEPFAAHGLAMLSRRQTALPCTCVGSPNASTNIIYLHGLDTVAPSWIELENRAKLQVLAAVLNARIAYPRAPGRWPQNDQVERSVKLIRAASAKCFGRGGFTLLGFSDGANVVNQLFLQCRTDLASHFISVGSGEGAASRASVPLSNCGSIVVFAGFHEPTFSTTKLFARQLAARGAQARFVEHAGPHEIPLRELLQVLRDETNRSF